MAKKQKQEPIVLDPPKDMAEYGRRFVRLGVALQDENETTKLRDLFDLAASCGLVLRFTIVPIMKKSESRKNK